MHAAQWLRPRIKPEHRPYRTADGNVRIGGVVYGIGAEITDPDGWIWELTQNMDGEHAPDEIIQRTAASFPDLAEDAVAAALADLVNLGYVEDLGAPIPDQFSERERERYSRGVPLLRWMDRTPRRTGWSAQEQLRQAGVLLIGVGGTGGFAAQGLVASGVGLLHCVDRDVVELSNLNRQLLYREPDIGKTKVDAATEALRALNSDVVVTGEQGEISGPGDLLRYLEPGYDLLVLGADRPQQMRHWANRVCITTGVPWLDGGYRGPLVQVGLFVPGKGACWECLRAGEVERRDLRFRDGEEEDVTYPRMPWNPVNAVTAGLSGNLMAHAALTYLTGVSPLEPGTLFGLNLIRPDDQLLTRFDRRPECPACGAGQAHTEEWLAGP